MTIINEEVLEETPEVNFEVYNDEAKKLLKKIEAIQTSGIYGIVGPYGSGKSTMIEQAKKKSEEYIKRVQFDAWMFPERKELWDGFVIEFFQQLSGENVRDDIERLIHGSKTKKEQNKDKKIETIALIADYAFEALKILSKTNPETSLDIITSLKIGEFIKLWSKALESIPVTRIYQYQQLFLSFFEFLAKAQTFSQFNAGSKLPIIVCVLEDIDRSNEEGMIFLETLSYFLKKLEKELLVGEQSIVYKIICLCPISDTSFSEGKNFDRYLKTFSCSYDYRIPQKTIEKFIDKLFEKSLNNEHLDFIKEIAIKKLDELTYREIKTIFGKINLEYKLRQPILYPELFFMFNLMLSIKTGDGGKIHLGFSRSEKTNPFAVISSQFSERLKPILLKTMGHHYLSSPNSVEIKSEAANKDIFFGNYTFTIDPKYFINIQ